MKPFHQDIIFKRNESRCCVTVIFDREITGDEFDVLMDNYKSGKIKTNPEKDIALAVCNQMALELQEAYDETGMSGHFKIQDVQLGWGIN